MIEACICACKYIWRNEDLDLEEISRNEWVNNGHVTCNIFEKWWKILIVYGEETGGVFDSLSIRIFFILYSIFNIILISAINNSTINGTQ